MISSTIKSIAILKANWDLYGKGYVDNFVPIVSECIRLSPNDYLSLGEIKDRLLRDFGLDLPQHSIEMILKRVKKRGYIEIDKDLYKRNNEKIKELNFAEIQGKITDKYDALIRGIISFCKDKFGITWNEKNAEEAIRIYLKDNEFRVLEHTISGSVIPNAETHPKNGKYIVGSFVAQIQKTKSTLLEALELIAQGNMLANAIFLDEPGQVSRKFKNTDAYFDTRFLICALGYADEPRQAPCTELLQLLYETGANLFCFNHNLDEINRILNMLARRFTEDQLDSVYGASIPSVEYFISQGYSASDIELLIVLLEKNLEALRVKVVDKPDYIKEYQIDEEALSKQFEQIGYSNPRAMQTDVDSISAIMRLRKLKNYYSIEDCRAIFITTNKMLSKICAENFCAESKNVISPCLNDYTLTNLLWLKKPSVFPDLPLKRVIADCYAATQPNERLWGKFIAEVDKLKESEKIETNDYYMLRHSLETKQALMEAIHGQEEAFAQVTIPEIINITRLKIQEEKQKELDLEKEQRIKAEAEAIDEREREARRIANISLRSKRCADVIVNKLIKYIVIIGLLIGIATTFPWTFPMLGGSINRYLVAFLQLVALVFIIADLFKGTTVKSFMRTMETNLAKTIENTIKRLSQ